jgi:hypothetical protein
MKLRRLFSLTEALIVFTVKHFNHKWYDYKYELFSFTARLPAVFFLLYNINFRALSDIIVCDHLLFIHGFCSYHVWYWSLQ